MHPILRRPTTLLSPPLRLYPSPSETLARSSLAEVRRDNRFYVHVATWAAWALWLAVLNISLVEGFWPPPLMIITVVWAVPLAFHGHRRRLGRRRFAARHRTQREAERQACEGTLSTEVEALRQRFLTASDEARSVLRSANPETGAQLTRGEGQALASIAWLADAGHLLSCHRLDPQLRRAVTRRLSERAGTPNTRKLLTALLDGLDGYDGRLAELEHNFEARRDRLESFLLALENVKMADAGAGLPPAVAASLKSHVGLLHSSAPPPAGEEPSQERIREEVRLAQDLQRSILPEAAPAVPGLTVAHLYSPWSEVGGDFYDFYALDPGRLLVALGDASGHGLDSSMISSMTKSALYLQVSARRDLSHSLAEINRMMCDTLGRRRLMTLTLCELDTEQRMFSWVNAGQVYPLLRRNGEIRELVQPGYPLGVRREVTYEIRQEPLEPGDLLVLLTDGYVEAADEDGELYGWERLAARLCAASTNDPESVLGYLATDLSNHLGAASVQDDVTLIAIAFEP
jgi:hypothetical protein